MALFLEGLCSKGMNPKTPNPALLLFLPFPPSLSNLSPLPEPRVTPSPTPPAAQKERGKTYVQIVWRFLLSSRSCGYLAMLSPNRSKQSEKPLKTASHLPAALTACTRYAEGGAGAQVSSAGSPRPGPPPLPSLPSHPPLLKAHPAEER